MSFSRWWLLAFGVFVAAPVWAEKAPAPDPYSPAQMLDGPSLRATGRVGTMAPEPRPDASEEIKAEPENADRKEKSVAPIAATVDRPPPERTGTIDDTLLDDEVQTRLGSLDDCRVDVARRRRVAPTEVQGDTLTLRWVIRPSGEVGATQVVATSPTDLDLMDCVKGVMSTWSFTPPSGGLVRVERAFKFRP
jgi:hypothetical protein